MTKSKENPPAEKPIADPISAPATMVETTANSTSKPIRQRTRTIEYVIAALSGMAPNAAKQLAEKFSDRERNELLVAYENRNAARGKLQSIRDRIADEKSPPPAT